MNSRILELEWEIEKLEDRISELEKDISNFELDPYDFEDLYIDSMDSEGAVNVAGLEFMPSDIIKEMDPTAYRCGLIDFVDGIDLSESKEYQTMNEDLEILTDELLDLQNELDDLENEGE
jgi:polyhydroxyalkanoate synthesis regulator phasin